MSNLRNPRSRFFRASAANVASLLLSAGVAFAQNNPVLAYRFVAQGKEIKTLHGDVARTTADGRIILEGDVDIPGKHQLPDIAWLACVSPDGHLLWSARAPAEPEAASLFPLTTDGDSIWAGGLRKDGIFRFAKFEAQSLHKENSVQLVFAPATYSSPCLQLHSERDADFDLQVSLVQPNGNSIRVALVSRDLRLRFDKRYTFGFIREDKPGNALAGAYLIRLADRSGFYFCLQHPLPGEGASSAGVGVIRLDNSGVIKWANRYAIGFSQFEAHPYMTTDGALIVGFLTAPNGKDSMLIKIAPDGAVKWAQSFPGLGAVSVANASFGSTAYRFIQPHLFATAGQVVSTKLFSILLALNYTTGEIEKQVKLNSPGGAFYTEKTNDSLYVTLLNPALSLRPGSSQAALLRFDFDLNLRAARSIRNAEPHWPLLHALSSGKLLFSYSYHAAKTSVVETVDENLDGANACGLLEKVNLPVAKTNFEARPIKVEAMPLPSIKISDANAKMSEAEMRLVPFELVSVACDTAPH
jgi:hypothetical protein